MLTVSVFFNSSQKLLDKLLVIVLLYNCGILINKLLSLTTTFPSITFELLLLADKLPYKFLEFKSNPKLIL